MPTNECLNEVNGIILSFRCYVNEITKWVRKSHKEIDQYAPYWCNVLLVYRSVIAHYRQEKRTCSLRPFLYCCLVKLTIPARISKSQKLSLTLYHTVCILRLVYSLATQKHEIRKFLRSHTAIDVVLTVRVDEKRFSAPFSSYQLRVKLPTTRFLVSKKSLVLLRL